MKLGVACRQALKSRDGGAAVEFALVGPIFILLIMATVVYGGWLWLAHGLQAVASDGARAALGGLDPGEQAAEARRFVTNHLQATTGLDPAHAVIEVRTTPEAITVHLSYDVSEHPLMALSALTPPPPRVIRRSAAVRTGGY